jgi:hypothetical protein
MTKLTTGKRVVQKSIGRVETAAKSAASNAVKGVATTAKRAVKAAPGPSSNPMSNIILLTSYCEVAVSSCATPWSGLCSARALHRTKRRKSSPAGA